RPTWVLPHTTPSRNTTVAKPSPPERPFHLRASVRSPAMDGSISPSEPTVAATSPGVIPSSMSLNSSRVITESVSSALPPAGGCAGGGGGGLGGGRGVPGVRGGGGRGAGVGAPPQPAAKTVTASAAAPITAGIRLIEALRRLRPDPWERPAPRDRGRLGVQA